MPANPKTAHLEFFGAEPGLTLYRPALAISIGNRSATGYEVICTAPCETSMPAGVTTLAVAKPSRPPVEAAPIALTPGSNSVQAVYHDRTGGRTAGWIVFGVGAGGGSALIVSNRHAVAAGVGIGIAGILLGTVLVVISRDSVDLRSLASAAASAAAAPDAYALSPALDTRVVRTHPQTFALVASF